MPLPVLSVFGFRYLTAGVSIVLMIDDRRLCNRKSIRKPVTTMGSNDLVVGEGHLLGPSCQRYNRQTGRCGSIDFGRSPRRG